MPKKFEYKTIFIEFETFKKMYLILIISKKLQNN